MGQGISAAWRQLKETFWGSPPKIEYLSFPLFTAPTAAPDAANSIFEAIGKLNGKAKELSSNQHFSTKYLTLISRAQTSATTQGWPDAHTAIWEATCLVNRALAARGATKERHWIGLYALLCFPALCAIGWWLAGVGRETSAVTFFGPHYWRYLLMGALGGVTVMVWGMVRHTIELDFDTDYISWYFFKPILGALAGLMAALVILGGFVAIQATSPAQEGSATINQLPLYIIAFLAGFSERFFIRLLDRVITALFAGEPTPAPPRAPLPTAVAQKSLE